MAMPSWAGSLLDLLGWLPAEAGWRMDAFLSHLERLGVMRGC